MSMWETNTTLPDNIKALAAETVDYTGPIANFTFDITSAGQSFAQDIDSDYSIIKDAKVEQSVSGKAFSEEVSPKEMHEFVIAAHNGHGVTDKGQSSYIGR